MAEFYRRTLLEELGTKHPGLLDFAEQAMRDTVPFPEIAAAILEQWDEKISPQALSNHRYLRVWKRKDAEVRAFNDKLAEGEALLELQKRHPTQQRQALIEMYLDLGIVTQQRYLMEADPLKLLAERRKWETLAATKEIETGKLQVALQNAQTEKARLAFDLDKLKAQREQEKQEVKRIVNDEEDREKLKRRIDEAYGLGAGPDPAPSDPGA
jgi:hypothetical protein